MENTAVQENPAMVSPPAKKSLFKNRDPNLATISSIVSFSGSTFFSKSIGEFISSYFVLFLTDFMMIQPMLITMLMLVTRIIDACTDPIAGAIVDMTHTRWGKSRPYILFSSFPLALFTVLIFYVPNFDMMGRLVYVYVMYIGYGLAQTMYSVPLATLAMSITADPKERKNIYTISGLVGTLGTAIPGAVPLILQYIATTHTAQRTTYFVIAMVIGVGTLIFGIFSFFAMKEKIQPISTTKKEKVSLIKNLGALFKNRPLICIFLSSAALSLRSMGYGSLIYFYKETLANYALHAFIGMGSSVLSYICMAAVPFFAKRFAPRTLCIAGYLYNALLYFIFFFVGHASLFWVAFFFIISGVPNGLIGTCSNLIVADSVDYMEWRTGVRSEGLVWSINGLKGKATSTLSGVWLPIGLSIIGYHTAMNASELVIQSDGTKQGLFYLVTLAPLAGSVLAIIPLLFDNFHGKHRDEIFEELDRRRAAAVAEMQKAEGAEAPVLAADTGVGSLEVEAPAETAEEIIQDDPSEKND
ncbi:MAG: MFS transporter [Clostridia bacterium]|nr:MFS transporter [Clostridia bacterium]